MKKALISILLMLAFAGYSRTVYIDPTYTGTTQNGKIETPYNSWGDFALESGNTYLQKRATTYTAINKITIFGKQGITIGAYGSGLLRAKFRYMGTGFAFWIESSDDCTIRDFEVDGNINANALVGIKGTTTKYLNNITVSNCILHNAHGSSGGLGMHVMYTNHLIVQYTAIRDVAMDGIYMAYAINTDIGYSTIHNVNKRYFVNQNQSASSGDGIQFDGNYNGFHLHHTVIARTNRSGNKYCVIFNSLPGKSDNATGVIEYCEFQTDALVSSAILIERGNGIIVRYNTFLGITQGLRIGGPYSNNIMIHGNTFNGCKYCIGVGYGAKGTKILNNQFTNTTKWQIWLDRSAITTCNNTSDGKGIPIYNYGGGTWTENCN